MSGSVREIQSRRKKFPLFWLVIIVGLALAVLPVSRLIRGVQVLEKGQELRADDFGFSIVSVRQLDKIGDGDESVRPRGKFLVVDIKVANHAKRVDFRFDPQIAILEDALGRKYALAAPAQNIVDRWGMTPTTLKQGEDCQRRIAFDVPVNIPEPRLKIVFGGRIGEILDWFIYGDRALRIT